MSVVGGRRHTRQDRGWEGGESWKFFSSVPYPSLYPSIHPPPTLCINISLPPSLSEESRLHPPLQVISFTLSSVGGQLFGCVVDSLFRSSLSLHSRINFLPILSAFTEGKSTFLCSIFIPVHYLAS